MWWPFVRFSALLWAMPVFENPAVTPRARIAVAMMLAFLVAGQLPLPLIGLGLAQGLLARQRLAFFAEATPTRVCPVCSSEFPVQVRMDSCSSDVDMCDQQDGDNGTNGVEECGNSKM